MKIDFTKEEYRSLVDLLSLAGFMLEGFGRGEDSGKAACFKLEQKILSYAEDDGCRGIIERDSDSGAYLRKWSAERDENVATWLHQYNDDLFWHEIIIRMAERDFNSKRAVEEKEPEEPVSAQPEKPSQLMELETHYEEEFVASGLDNLVLRNRAAEGIN